MEITIFAIAKQISKLPIHIVTYISPNNTGVVNPFTSNFGFWYLFRNKWEGYAYSVCSNLKTE